MRAITLVALGAALIWLGLSRGVKTNAADSEEEPRQETSLPDGATSHRAETPESQDGAPTPPVSPEAIRDRTPAQLAGGTALAELTPAAANLVPVPSPTLRVARPSADLDLGGGQAATQSPTTHAVATGGPLVEAPERLARLLIESWVGRAGQGLQEYIQAGEGAQLPVGSRQLVASFWQACMGETERASAQLMRLESEASVTGEQVRLLRAALENAGARAIPSSSSVGDPLARAMRMVLYEDEGRVALERGDFARASEVLSELVLMELAAPWPPQREALLLWGEKLHSAQRRHRLSPDGRWPAVEYVVKSGDSLIAIRKRVLAAHPELLLNTGLMGVVNAVKDGRITAGDVLRLPTDSPNVLVDLDARVVVFRLGSEAVRMWQVGIGRAGHETPVGTYTVGEKLERPSHMPVGGKQLPFGHPENPLGTRWIAWNSAGKNTSFGFHGTSDPEGVGEEVSQGCIRMRNEDVEELYELIPKDARIVVQP
jgi:hypothetical protein